MTPDEPRSLPIDSVFLWLASASFATTLTGIPWLAAIATAFLTTIALLELPVPRILPRRITPIRAAVLGTIFGIIASIVTLLHLSTLATVGLVAVFAFLGCAFLADPLRPPFKAPRSAVEKSTPTA